MQMHSLIRLWIFKAKKIRRITMLKPLVKKFFVLGILTICLGIVLGTDLNSVSAEPDCQTICIGSFLYTADYDNQSHQCVSTGQVVGFCPDI
jgi:hypothetical protein